MAEKTITETDERIEALEALLALFDDWQLAADIAPKLNCGEVDTLAGALEAFELEAAGQWRLQHAIEDDCEEHEELREQWKKEN